jgi:hypothetical protein
MLSGKASFDEANVAISLLAASVGWMNIQTDALVAALYL